MSELLVDVSLYGKKAGVLTWNSKRQMGEFQFYTDYLKNGWDLAPLVMPLDKVSASDVFVFPENRNACFSGLPGFVADALPDRYGTKIIDTWFSTYGLSGTSITPLDRLCYIGRRAMGALEFEPFHSIRGLDESTILRMDCLVDLADEVFRNREAFQNSILQEDKTILDILKIGTSAGGAKPKAIIALDEKNNIIRSGQVKAPEGFTYWLLKFDGTVFNEKGYTIEHPKGIGNIEYAYYKMAVDCGIDMAESRLLTERDACHFMTKRFDRTDNGDKIHMQTLAAMAHYDRDELHSYEEGFKIMRTLNLPYNSMEQFFRRMVFNVVARNHDDHTKNHSFLMDRRGRWSLAPAYDLCYSYSPEGRWTSVHQMCINGKRDNFTWDDLSVTGKRMDINQPDNIIAGIVDVVSRWRDYAKDCGVHVNHAVLIEKNLILWSDKNLKEKIEDTTQQITDDRHEIKNIIIFESAGGVYKIRCKIDGEQKMGVPLDTKDSIKWNLMKMTGNKENLDTFKKTMVEKYFKGDLAELSRKGRRL